MAGEARPFSCGMGQSLAMTKDYFNRGWMQGVPSSGS
jgi:hypothetical protein